MAIGQLLTRWVYGYSNIWVHLDIFGLRYIWELWQEGRWIFFVILWEFSPHRQATLLPSMGIFFLAQKYQKLGHFWPFSIGCTVKNVKTPPPSLKNPIFDSVSMSAVHFCLYGYLATTDKFYRLPTSTISIIIHCEQYQPNKVAHN